MLKADVEHARTSCDHSYHTTRLLTYTTANCQRTLTTVSLALQELGLPHGAAKMRHVMSKYDTDHSGTVDLGEFTHYMSVRER